MRNNVTYDKCEICQKEAQFTCSQCESVKYCSKNHQILDWKQKHKGQCNNIKQMKNKKAIDDEMTIKKYDFKKNYFENYSNKMYQQCLIDAKVLVGFERKLLDSTQGKTTMQQFQYAASICLLIKTYLLLNDKRHAELQMKTYLREKHDFLSELSEITPIKYLSKQSKQILQKKANLLSTIANLCYVIGINCLEYYMMYTKLIEFSFGPQSYQVSNCYFLIGCFLVEEGYFNRAIACFHKAAKLRGNSAGDCYFNIGVLCKMQNNLTKSLEMFELAYKLREQQYGEDSNEIAEVHENMGMLYVELNDFKTAMLQYQKAFRIRSNAEKSPQYENVVNLIHQLLAKLEYYIKLGQPDMKKHQIYTHLRDNIMDRKAYWKEKPFKNNKQQAQAKQMPNKRIQNETINQEQNSFPQSFDKNKRNKLIEKKQIPSKTIVERLFKLSQSFLSQLTPGQLFKLSQLQLQLEVLDGQYAIVYSIAQSQFLQSLTKEKYQQLALENKSLFQLIQLQTLKNQQKKYYE